MLENTFQSQVWFRTARGSRSRLRNNLSEEVLISYFTPLPGLGRTESLVLRHQGRSTSMLYGDDHCERQVCKVPVDPKFSPLMLSPMELPAARWDSVAPKLICCCLTGFYLWESNRYHPKKKQSMRKIPLHKIQNPPPHIVLYIHLGLGIHHCFQRQLPNVQIASNTLLQDKRHMSVRQRFRGYLQNSPPASIHSAFHTFANWQCIMQDIQQSTSSQHP
jgi:hypothetical protein